LRRQGTGKLDLGFGLRNQTLAPHASNEAWRRLGHFSLDALVNIATAIGRRVHMELESV
jgi:hypothetical protein